MTMFMNSKTHYIEGIISLQNDVYCRLCTFLFRIPVGFYIVLGKLILKLMRKAKDIFEEKEWLVKLTLCLVAQSCPTLWDPIDCSSPGSSVHGFSQARILKWVGMRPLPGDFPNPGIEPRFPSLQTDSLLSEPPGKPRVQ